MAGTGVIALLLALLGQDTLPAATHGAGGTHVLLVTGLSGEPRFASAFHSAAAAIYDAAKARWVSSDSSLVYLAEDPALDPQRIRGRATRDAIAAAITALGARSAPADVVLIVLIGHGSGQGADSRLSLPGPDATAADFATWLTPLGGRLVVLVNGSSASGDFIPIVAAPGRVVMTATKSAMERNETTFFEHFARGLTTEAADADRDGRVTVLEAFAYTRREVAKGYESRSLLATEHAVLNDSSLARTVAFGTTALPSDPKVAAIAAERRALEAQVDALRRRKGVMDSTAYQRELERLLVEIATRTAAMRAAEGRKP